ncbi:tungstate transport system substrate-binding protein [Limimonas halophila]|uniref:Tungstate transport system substrate-binding protein n=1 Tax=Limimonas halophila TaxID=1082479 RepID=A0A1G7U080_9PROT|nr:substrate-binding domain-containing protein [Limimonas halophila]SDG40946.1 tungstate transport system substrate-binding protein [Limimonas halophila]
MRHLTRFAAAALAVLALAVQSPAQAGEDRGHIIVQSTTSTEASGLFDHILPRFESMTGIDVRVVAVGTGQAIENARNGDGDVLLVHHTPGELKFVADGYGVRRFGLMYNQFVIVGPKADPAGVNGMSNAAKALSKIAESGAAFASRGDDSGTHRAELALWDATDIDVESAGSWYRETGAGMGETLNTAVQMGAYTLTDSGTWLNFENKGDYTIHVKGDTRQQNQYGVMVVNPDKHDHVKVQKAQAFVDWLVSAPGQRAIASYTIDGQQAFTPNAR